MQNEELFSYKHQVKLQNIHLCASIVSSWEAKAYPIKYPEQLFTELESSLTTKEILNDSDLFLFFWMTWKEFMYSQPYHAH